MTRSQTELLRLLKKLNKDAAAYDRPYIRNAATLEKIASATHPDAAARLVEGEKTGTPAFIDTRQTGNDDNPLEVFIWAAYMGTRITSKQTYNKDDPGDPWYIFRQALAELIKQTETFAQISQNPAINALAILSGDDLIRDDLGGATATIRKKSGDISVKFSRRNDGTITEWDTSTKMMLAYLLEDYQAKRTHSTRISLRDYAARRGLKAKDLRDFQEETGRALNNLAALTSLDYQEKIGGKWTHSGGFGLNGGTHRVARNVIEWNWNIDLLPSLERLAPLDLPKEAWSKDVRTNQFQVIYIIAKNYRLNEGRKRQDKIKISSFLAELTGIPAIEKVRQQRQSAKSKIIRPFLRDLDAFESFTYDIVDENGKIIANPENMSYDDFIKAYVQIDYTDWPSHTDRIESREKREKKKKQGKKPVSKSGGESDADPRTISTQNRGDLDAGDPETH